MVEVFRKCNLHDATIIDINVAAFLIQIQDSIVQEVFIEAICRQRRLDVQYSITREAI